MDWVHCVEFRSNVALPISFDIVASNGLSLFAVCAAKFFCELGNIDVMLFEEAPFIEDGDDRGLKL